MTKNTQESDSLDFIAFVWSWRKQLIVIGIVAAIVSVIVSLMLEDKYESVVTLYPAKSSRVTFSNLNTKPDDAISAFGEAEESEQMMQLLESAEIRDYILGKYNLMSHYKIDSTDRFKFTKLYKKYKKNIQFERTRFGSVLIKVLDVNPVKASDMANDISMMFDSVKNRMIRERAYEEYVVKKRKVEELKIQVDLMLDTMNRLSEMGVVSGSARAALTEALANAKDPKTADAIRIQIQNSDKYGSLLGSYIYKLELLNDRLSDYEAAFEQAEADANMAFTHKFVVEKAFPAERKAWPVRSVMVIVSTFAALFFGVVILLILEKIRKLKAAGL
ncbi:MAG: hypothetical protein ACK4K0_04425 [Flavobacteriales bacterium]